MAGTGHGPRTPEQIAYLQKMAAVSLLAGSIAHDFNNLLGVIIGSLETLQRRLPTEDERILRPIEVAMKGAHRGAALLGRLLAFSQQQPLAPKMVDVDQFVAAVADMLRRSLGETIAIETVRPEGLWRAMVDAGRLEGALVDLAANARDAMPEGGKLTLETANATLDEAYAAAHGDVRAGDYVMIAVGDTGAGMAKDVLARAFEPFFTTKQADRGVGLGLSEIYGFLKQSGGHVAIRSEPGKGTVVRLYLPRHAAGDVEAKSRARPPAPRSRR